MTIVQTTEVKVVEASSAQELTTMINEHLALNWQIAGNNYQVVRLNDNIHTASTAYSILMMIVRTPVDPEIKELYETSELGNN